MAQDPQIRLRKVGVGFLLTFCLFFFLGSFNFPLSFELRKAEIGAFFNQDKKETHRHAKSIAKQNKSKQIIDSAETAQQQTPVKVAKGATPVDTPEGVERVLLLGDSQLEGLRSPVSAYCDANGHVLVATIIYYGSSTKQWGSSDTLDYYLDLYKPSVVVFAIGLNELFVNDFEQRAVCMRNIIKSFNAHNVRYSWIGPAAWTKDKGIISVMQKEVGSHFFASHELQLERSADGRHPSKSAAKLWFDQVALSLTEKGVIDLSKKVETLPKLKFTRTILMNVK
jgi:hypothetical protein